jgi:hypothetical protein
MLPTTDNPDRSRRWRGRYDDRRGDRRSDDRRYDDRRRDRY